MKCGRPVHGNVLSDKQQHLGIRLWFVVVVLLDREVSASTASKRVGNLAFASEGSPVLWPLLTQA